MVSDFYSEGGYLQKHPNWHVEDAAWKAGNIFRMIQRNKINPQTVCEIGCGAGEILVQLQKKLPENVTYDGFEVSPHAYESIKIINMFKNIDHQSEIIPFGGMNFMQAAQIKMEMIVFPWPAQFKSLG